MEYLLLVVGFVLLIKGADFFVEGSSSVAKLLHVPSIIIGLTVVAFGTSMPEASVSITAAFQGKNDLAVSNVIGSNIFNLMVVLGATAMVKPVKAKRSVLKQEFPFSILITLVLLLAICVPRLVTGSDVFVLGRTSGVILLIFFGYFLWSTIRQALKSRREGGGQEEGTQLSPLKSALYIIGGIAAIVLGGDWVVDSATVIAESFHLSQTFIGLTIVAMGTSLPELVTSMVAAGKGENDLAVGNVVGSNIFNILLILGASSAILPIQVEITAVYDTMILILFSVLVYVFAVRGQDLRRREGAVLLLSYCLFFAYIVMR